MTSSEVSLPDGRSMLIQWAPIRSGQKVLAVETITDITDGKRREDEYRRLKELFEHQATVDPLTELLNRRGWAYWRRTFGGGRFRRMRWWIALSDLDHFKR